MDLSLPHDATLLVACLVAATVAVLHTLAGPDHYIPFVALRRSSGWSRRRTVLVTIFCGLGHCGSSVLLAFGAVWLGKAATGFDAVQAYRSDLAALGLLLFGLWLTWRGIARARRGAEEDAPSLPALFWSLFIVFVLGPCEWLIPASVASAARFGFGGLVAVVVVFSATTVATMVAAVFVLSEGLVRIPFGRIERHAVTLSGVAVSVSGALILVGF